MRVLLVIFLLHFELSIAQTKLPVIIPASPEVSSLMNDVSFSSSLYTGAAQTNFNFHTLNLGSFQMAITADYFTNGIRVDEIPSRIGLGWKLNAGGYVSRVIRDEPDGSSLYVAPPNDLTQKNLTLYNYLNMASSQGYDTEWDEYSYSFNGYSGKFYVDDNGNGITIPLNNLKIKVYGHNQTSKNIEIYTPDGVKYEFGITSKEKTKQVTTQDAGSTVTTTKSYVTETAWFLDRIVTTENQEINLYYSSIINTAVTGNTQQMIKPFYSSTACNGSPCPYSITTSTNFTKYDSYYLNKIACTAEVVDLYYENRPDNSGDVRLKTLVVREAQSFSYKKLFRFDYYTPTYNNSTINKRYFLTAIRQKEIGTGQAENFDSGTFLPYSYDYFDMNNMPDRLTYGQDWFGYNNGATNNAYLVPFISSIADYVSLGYSGGNRNPSNITDVQKGALKTVQLPTGGYKEFEYEQHTLLTNLSTPQYSTASVVGGGSGENSPSTFSSNPFYISADQNVQLTTESKKGPFYTTSTTGEGSKIYELKLINTTTNQVLVYRKYYFYQTENLNVFLAGGNTYRLDLTIWGDLNAGTANINYNYSTVTAFENKPVPGMRVKKVITYDPVSKKWNKVFYRYASYTDLSKSSAVGPTGAVNFNLERYGTPCDAGTFQARIEVCNSYLVNSNSLFPVNLFSGSPYAYSNVIESDDSTFANGFTEHMFHTYIPSTIMNTWLGSASQINATNMTTVLNGLEYKTRVYKKGNSGFVLLKEVENQFEYDNYTAYKDNFYIAKRWDHLGVSSPIYYAMFNGFDLVEYRFVSNWIKKTATTVKDFDENGLNPIVKTDTFTYAAISHQQVTKQASTSSSNESNITEFYYPIDKGMSAMLTAYRIATPVHIRNIKSNKLQSETETTYGLFGNYLGVSQVEERILGNAGKKVLFNAYDSKGRVTEVKRDNDKSISYIWMSNSDRVLAEVQNASKDDIAYTSFEDDADGNWSISSGNRDAYTFFSGKYGYSLANGAIQRTTNSNKTYTLTYWTKSSSSLYVPGTNNVKAGPVLSNGWRFFEHTLSGVSSVQLSGWALIDELSLYPSGAQIKTFTYNDMGLISSVSDESGKSKLFTYDGLGRLKQVLDEGRNILDAYQYVYMQPSSSCSSFSPNWQVTGVTRCQKNSNNNNTGYIEQQSQDINPCSASYLQTSWTTLSYSPFTCPAITNCSGEDKRLVNGFCETGMKVVTSSGVSNDMFYCVYHYEWSDGYWSTNYTGFGAECVIE